MSIEEAQRLVDEWIKNIGGGYFSELTNMVLLTEEVGELARIGRVPVRKINKSSTCSYPI